MVSIQNWKIKTATYDISDRSNDNIIYLDPSLWYDIDLETTGLFTVIW